MCTSCGTTGSRRRWRYSGDTLVFDLREVSDNQITHTSTADDLTHLDWSRIYPLGGPVAVKGAQPGDVLEVEILDPHPRGWGWTGIIPDFGLLEERASVFG